jgi:hypothetical protein
MIWMCKVSDEGRFHFLQKKVYLKLYELDCITKIDVKLRDNDDQYLECNTCDSKFEQTSSEVPR